MATRIGVSPNELLVEIEALLRSLPTGDELASDRDEILAWRGKAIATISAWSIVKGSALRGLLDTIDVDFATGDRASAIRQIRVLLHEARHTQLLALGGSSGSVTIPAGAAFNYFAELTKRLQLASRDVFFVDPYLNAEFVERYLPQIGTSVTIRLLSAPSYMPKLVPAAEMFVKQHGANVAVREAVFHDRFVFIDGSVGFQSGASFKDGAMKAPTGLIEIVDALPAMLGEYENIWRSAIVRL